MKKFYSYIVAAILMAGFIGAFPKDGWATDWSYTFNASSNISKGSNTLNGVSWTIDHDSEYSNNEFSGYHVGSSSKTVSFLELSTSGISGTITKIVVNAKGNGTGGTISASVNGTAYSAKNNNTAISNTSQDFEFTGSLGGEIIIRLAYSSAQKKNFYVTSITVTYSVGSTYTVTYAIGEGGSGTVPTDGTSYAQGATVTVKDRGSITHATLGFRGWSDGTNTYNPGETFTMGDANVTLTAVWTTKCTFAYSGNGNTGGSVPSSGYYDNYGAGAKITVLGNTGSLVKTGSVWDGWTDGTTDYEAGDEITISANTTLSAKWRELAIYTLVTSVDDIEPGKHYIIASSKTAGDDATAMGEQGSTGNNRVAVPVTVSNVSSKIKITEATGLKEFVISGPEFATVNNVEKKYYTIYDESISKYLYAAGSGSGKNYLKNQDTNDGNSKWTITFSSDAAVITAQGDNTNNIIRKNSSNAIFSCYNSGQNAVYLYKKDGDTDGTIYSATTLSKDESYNNLTIVKTVVNETPVVNGSITVPNAKTLTVTGTLTNQGTAANLVIEDGGQLITSNDVNATVKRHIDAYDPSADPTDGWYFIASPVSYNPNGTDLLSNTYDLFLYDEDDVMWRNYEQSGDFHHFTMQPKQGYLYANSEDVDLSFAGQMPASNTANVIVDLSYSDGATKPGFNLVGNPFTCNVSGFKLKNKTTSEVSDLTTYYVVEGGTEIVSSTDPIKPGQGFMVEAGESNQQLVFNYVAAKGETATKPAFVSIEAGNDAFMDRAFVQIGQGNTLRKMKLNENVAHVWLMQDGKDYAAASIAEASGEMPVSFKAAKDGEYTLTVNAEGVEMNYLHLIDNLTGADTDLLATQSYTFNARTTDYASRFRLVFGANDENGASTSSATFAYVSNGQVVVNGTGTLQVVDMLGRIVASQEVTTANCQLSTANYKTGVYVLRLVNNGDVKTQKMVIE